MDAGARPASRSTGTCSLGGAHVILVVLLIVGLGMLVTGDPVDIRFDPKHPATVRLSEHFVGTDLPAALIVFGCALILISLFFFIG